MTPQESATMHSNRAVSSPLSRLVLSAFRLALVWAVIVISCWPERIRAGSDRIEVVEQPMGVILGNLQALGYRVCFEEVKIDSDNDRVVDADGQISWRKKKISVTLEKGAGIEDQLRTIVALDDEYDWYRYKDSDLYVVFPTTRRSSMSHESEMMWLAGPINAHEKKLEDVLLEDFRIADHNTYLDLDVRGRASADPLERRVTLAITEMPFRDALTELLSHQTDLYWTLAGLRARALRIDKVRHPVDG